MKKIFASLMLFAMLCSTVGCANGPVRTFLRNAICNDRCQAPPVQPPYGFGISAPASGDCATGNCNNGVIDGNRLYGTSQVSDGVPHTTSYLNDGYSQGDPYINGSNYGGATINPPVFDSSSGPTYGSKIVPPASSGTLPTPSSRN